MLTPRERRRGLVVLFLTIVLALVETLGVASIMPFLAVLGNPEIIQTNALLQRLYAVGSFETVNSFLFALGSAAFVLVVFTSLFRAGTHYALIRFSNLRRHSLGERLLAGYLHQPYTFFLNRNSADLSKTILTEVDQVVLHVLIPVTLLIAFGFTAVVLTAFLVAVNPWIALAVACLIGLTYLCLYRVARGLLNRSGEDSVNANRERFTAASEAFGGIKEVKLLGREHAYLRRFREPSLRVARHQSTTDMLARLPTYLMEAVGFGGVMALALVLLATLDGLGEILPILGLYTFAAYRLLPAAQNIYGAMTRMRFGLPALDSIHKDLCSKSTQDESEPAKPSRPLRLRKGIRFEGVSFEYSGATAPAVNNLSFRISAGSLTGFVGATGSGKTTTIDLVLGLLQPTRGAIFIDETPLCRDVVRSWQKLIGYVPQQIFLSDATIAENIAFGIPVDEINHTAVRNASRVAQLHPFVAGELRDGYQTRVGERGVRLSGGQRQRIGIARALYRNPELLVLDEATNALDHHTEDILLRSIKQLPEKTVIVVTHRLNTVRHCDTAFLLDQGLLMGAGNLDSLAAEHPHFKHMLERAETRLRP